MLVIRMYCESRPDIYVYKCRLNFLEAVRIWEVRHVYPDGGDPDGNACHVSPWGAWHVFSGGVRIWGARHVYPDGGDPDGNACHVSPWGAWHVFSGGGVPTVLTPQCPTWWLHILLSNDKRSDRSHSYLYTFSHPSLAFSPSIFFLNFLIIIWHDFFNKYFMKYVN